MLRSLRRLLGHEAPRPLALELRRRGASRELWRFAQGAEELLSAWFGAPRAPLCVELALRCGVDRALVVEATGDLVASVASGEAGPRDDREWAPEQSSPRVSAELLAVTQEAAERLRASEVSIEDYCVQIAVLTYAIVEARPQVRRARAAMDRARDWGRFGELLAATDEYDTAYAGAHLELANLVRKRIPAELVRAAFEGVRAHPYR